MWKRHRKRSKSQDEDRAQSKLRTPKETLPPRNDSRTYIPARAYFLPCYSFAALFCVWWLSNLAPTKVSVDISSGNINFSDDNIHVHKDQDESALDRASSEQHIGLPTIHLIGERHSGTNWLHDHLVECFGSQTHVLDRVTRFRHWFQEDTDRLPGSSEMVVVAIFRSPYTWVEELRKKPYQIPLHRDLDWKTFVTRPYTMPRYGTDLRDKNQSAFCGPTTFTFDEVIPCHQDRYLDEPEFPFYELKHDKSGEPYDSVVDLRADKIRNFLEVERYKRVKSLQVVRREVLLEEGTELLIRELEKQAGLKATCKPMKAKRQADIIENLSPEYLQWMNKNVDWEAEALIGYKPHGTPIFSRERKHGKAAGKKDRETISPKSAEKDVAPVEVAAPEAEERKTIHLLGERHSGTNWMFNHLNDCFGKQTEVSDRVSRFKHWFQTEEGLPPTGPDMVVIAQFRNPYTWVEALRKQPHHMMAHLYLDWHTFVTKPYTMPRFGKDLKADPKDPCDQDGYVWNEVIPCHREKEEEILPGEVQFDPIYELNHDMSGNPYASVIDLRADKIKNFLDVENYKRVKSFRAVRYETMVEGGTEWLIRQVEVATGLKADCEPFPPRKVVPRALYGGYLDWMEENVDWQTEGLIGYTIDDVPLRGVNSTM